VPPTRISTRWNPLRAYQFRVGLLPPPDSSADRTFLGEPVEAGPQDAAGGGREQYVAGVKKVSGLNVSISSHEVWEGGNALHRYANPDRASWDAITLEQGLAINDTLERWANAVVRFLQEGTVDPGEPVKRNLFIDVWDPHLHSLGGGGAGGGGAAAAEASGPGEEDARLRRYLVFNAWVSRFQAIPQLDAMSSEVALLTVELTHEGWRSETPTGFGTPPPVPPTPGTEHVRRRTTW
jgi:phage tail-like protein